MATVAKSGRVSLATLEPGYEHQINQVVAGEAIANGDLCYINADGKAWRTNGTAANAAALFDGICLMEAVAGDGVTLLHGVVVHYGAALTPGARYYVSATAGAVSDVATTGGTVPIGKAIDVERILFFATR